MVDRTQVTHRKPRRLALDGRADVEGVTGTVASRTVVGGALGAIAGALILGATTALLTNGSIALVAAIGGAFIGGVFGATWVVFAGLGGSEAYRQRFIAPELTDVCIVSLHTDDATEAAHGRTRLGDSRRLTVVEVDGNGHTTSAARQLSTSRSKISADGSSNHPDA